ncbi:MAG TPA: adenylate/guanylate cyclase domain-containing protein [Haliangiales bacterium]|nr:adenylate/guanylate cyclase domain-containing protein [Haliangiales bacterium]
MTLRRLFVLALLVLGALLGGLVVLLSAATRDSVVAAGEALRGAAAAKLTAQLEGHFAEGGRAIGDIEADLLHGLAGPDAASREASVFGAMLRHPILTEAALTDDDGQISVVRAAGSLDTRWVHRDGDAWVADLRHRPPGGGLAAGAFARQGPAEDPTAHLTYTTPREPRFAGRALWSDLAYLQMDAEVPERLRRKGVTVQKAIRDPAGRVLGVVRAGAETRVLDELSRARVNEDDPLDPHRVFVCDARGRLISRIIPTDVYDTVNEDGAPDPDGDDVRVVTPPGPAIAAALARPELRAVQAGKPAAARFDAPGGPYLVTFSRISDYWVLGILATEAYYVGDLTAERNRLLGGIAAVVGLVLVVGFFALRRAGRDLGRIAAAARRMQRFDFAVAAPQSRFRDVAEVEESLEQANTALRALGKYVPVSLVRQLYAARREPMLGGELMEVTLLFTDIEGFTSTSEALPPETLARALGQYLGALSDAVAATGGTVDKFIGDSVMAFWNAPAPQPDHGRRACTAAIACLDAAERLYESPAWAGLPRWRTRVGVHTGRVVIGHFGAPDRLSYTAIGDAVNLAARLEGQNKEYGTSILVTESTVKAAGDGFAFRRVACVAVRGKTEAVEIYELRR